MRSKTFCRICEAACGLTFEDGKLRPDKLHPVSRGFVCAKGTRFGEVAGHASRLRTPMIRVDGDLRPASWAEATEAAAAGIRPILERYGPDAVGIYVGNPLAFAALGQLSALALGRALGTRNVFTAGSQDCSNKFAAARLMHGSAALHPIPDFEHTELAVLRAAHALAGAGSGRRSRAAGGRGCVASRGFAHAVHAKYLAGVVPNVRGRC